MDSLMSKSKKELCALVMEIQEENKSLKLVQTFIKSTMKRLEYLERIAFISQQYERRTCVEITGIPADIPTTQLENEVIKIYEVGGFKVHGKSLDQFDIQAAHRKRNKSTVIVKFVNRKFAYMGLSNGKELKDKNIYGEGTKVYINDSFCPEYGFLNYLIRNEAKRNRNIKYKVRNGINQIKMPNTDEFEVIAHKHDLIRLGITIPDYEFDSEAMCFT